MPLTQPTQEVPLARHSLLPELRRLVQFFRPTAISPNTLVPASRGMDYYLFPQLFGEMLSKEELERAKVERDSWFVKHRHFGGEWLVRLKRQEEQICLLAFIGSFNLEHDNARHPSGSTSAIPTDTRGVSYVDQVTRLLGPPICDEGDRLNKRVAPDVSTHKPPTRTTDQTTEPFAIGSRSPPGPDRPPPTPSKGKPCHNSHSSVSSSASRLKRQIDDAATDSAANECCRRKQPRAESSFRVDIAHLRSISNPRPASSSPSRTM